MCGNIPVVYEPMRWSSHWIDLFRYSVNSRDGLPPSARAAAILAVMKQLQKYRKSPSLWVTIDSPGAWYINELMKALSGCYQSIAVTALDAEVNISSFFRLPGAFPAKPSAPSFLASVFDEFSLHQKERAKLQALRALARMTIASTKEIASTSGYSHTYMRKLLPELADEGYIRYHEKGLKENRIKYPVWQIKPTGIRYAHQSWNIPENVKFKGIRVEQKYAGQKHRKIARMWWAWLKEAYGSDYEIWQTWSEPSIGNAHPDALAWGSYKGVETLAWLEVESGKKSGKRTVEDIKYRYSQAMNIAEQDDVDMLFVVLAPPWVLRVLQSSGSFPVSGKTALIFENWRNFRYLSTPIFGGNHLMMQSTEFPYVKDIVKPIYQELGLFTSRNSHGENDKS